MQTLWLENTLQSNARFSVQHREAHQLCYCLTAIYAISYNFRQDFKTYKSIFMDNIAEILLNTILLYYNMGTIFYAFSVWLGFLSYKLPYMRETKLGNWKIVFLEITLKTTQKYKSFLFWMNDLSITKISPICFSWASLSLLKGFLAGLSCSISLISSTSCMG